MFFYVRPASMALSILLAVLDSSHADTKEEITKLIPAASAMRKADFEKMAQSSTVPRASDVDDKSLTWMLLTTRAPEEARPKEQIEEFEYLVEQGAPKPTRLAGEMYRTIGAGKFRLLRAPVTMIQADRIKDVTVEVADDTAEGAIRFEVPKLYRGRVRYVAKKANDQWRITEFKMPAHGMHIVRGDDGKWADKTGDK